MCDAHLLGTSLRCPAAPAPAGHAGNLKATSPIAFTTTLLVWGLMAFGKGFQAAGQTAAALDSIRWGSDYLLKARKGVCVRVCPLRRPQSRSRAGCCVIQEH